MSSLWTQTSRHCSNSLYIWKFKRSPIEFDDWCKLLTKATYWSLRARKMMRMIQCGEWFADLLISLWRDLYKYRKGARNYHADACAEHTVMAWPRECRRNRTMQLTYTLSLSMQLYRRTRRPCAWCQLVLVQLYISSLASQRTQGFLQRTWSDSARRQHWIAAHLMPRK